MLTVNKLHLDTAALPFPTGSSMETDGQNIGGMPAISASASRHRLRIMVSSRSGPTETTLTWLPVS